MGVPQLLCLEMHQLPLAAIIDFSLSLPNNHEKIKNNKRNEK